MKRLVLSCSQTGTRYGHATGTHLERVWSKLLPADTRMESYSLQHWTRPRRLPPEYHRQQEGQLLDVRELSAALNLMTPESDCLS